MKIQIKKIIKSAGSFIAKWSDALIVLPVTAALVLTNTAWARYIDPTSNVLDAGFIVLLNFNLLKLVAIMLVSYFFWQLYFRADIFREGWEKIIGHPVASAIISFLFWVSILIVSYLTITKDL